MNSKGRASESLTGYVPTGRDVSGTLPFPSLPAMKTLGDLSTLRPCIITDSREQCPLTFSRLPSVRACLPVADYSAIGLESVLAIERKSLDDLASCCCGANRERLERELRKLSFYRFPRLLIVGTKQDILAGRYTSNVNPKSVLNTLHSWETRFNIPVVHCATPGEAANQVEVWAWWMCRQVVEEANILLRSLKGATTPSS